MNSTEVNTFEVQKNKIACILDKKNVQILQYNRVW